MKKQNIHINRLLMLGLAGLALAASACESILPSEPPEEEVLAGPIDGLTSQQLASHFAGDEEFARVFGFQDGLGPVFVSNSCESCHLGDGKGHPLTTLTRFGRMTGGIFDHLAEEGGPQLQNRAIAGYPVENIPAHATGVTRLMPPAVTGLGYLEMVDDATLLQLADPDDANGDGISGRPNYVDAPDFFMPSARHQSLGGKFIGRFGKKAGAIDLLQQTVTAYREDMGITTDFSPEDIFNIRDAGYHTGDGVADPEASSSVVRSVVFYLRTLKIPPRRNVEGVRAGEEIFQRIGCAGCHVPSMRTGASDIAALNNVEFHAYTDLLLHDMGPELDDGYTEGSALTSEWRTAPLWGIGLAETSQGGAAFFMHDGRARTLEAAIALHGGEGDGSRRMFNALSMNDRNRLLEFLRSL